MFALALLIGIYSYTIFSLGLLGILHKQNIVITSVIFLTITILLFKNKISLNKFKNKIVNYIKKTSKLGLILLFLVIFQSLVNLIGTLGPELGFDALWYHLTLPKIYLMNSSIDYIPGGHFYYSAMPKLTEMLYVVGLALGNEIVAKFIHFGFGILCLVAIYKISRKFLLKDFSLLALVLFYSNLVVGWMSITAYIDLARTFFEVMAFWGFLEWVEKKDKKWLVVSAVLLGLAISTKLLAIGSLFIFTILIFFALTNNHKTKLKNIITNILVYWWFALLVPLPWFIFSFIQTGSPIYPFFTGIYPIKMNISLINPLTLSDPISPFYLIMLPIALILYKKFTHPIKIVFLYSFLAIIIWYLTPQTGGGRFILPYLAVFSIVSIIVLKKTNNNTIKFVLMGLIIFFSIFSIAYRLGANFKYIPVILGKESKSQFLSNHLNFAYGDFYDTDGHFSKKIKSEDKVLLFGLGRLYYVNFPFIDSSYVKKGDMFNYIAVQGNNLPERFKFWNLIYYNKKVDVKLYSIGGLKWAY